MKQKPHYVNNKEFTNAVFEYNKLCTELEAKEQELPEIPEYIASCIFKIAEKLSHSSNFIGYSYRDEMVMDAVENCIKVVRNYDIEKSTRIGEPNAFGYFTQIAYYAFLRRIHRENRQIDIKMRYMENISIDDVAYTSEDSDSFVDSNFIEKLREQVDIARKNNTDIKQKEEKAKEVVEKKKIGLEHFLND